MPVLLACFKNVISIVNLLH